MTDAPPPSIPPRERPTSPDMGDVRTVRRVPGQAGPSDETLAVPTGGSTGGTASGSEGTAAGAAAPARTPRPVTRPVSGATARPDEKVGRTGSRGAREGDGATGATAVPPPPSGFDAVVDGHRGTDGDDEPDGPSPLMEAVDRSTVWLKKTAGTAGAGLAAAYASLTRPRPQETPMTANPTAPASSARPAPVPPPHPTTGRAPAPGAPRRVRLAISRLDPWSVMKLSLLLSFALGIILVVATAVVWFTLDGLHVFASINDLVKQVVGPESAVNVTDVISFRKVISGATLVAVIDVFLLTAMATIGAFLYNIVAALVGGVHVTMTDE